MKCYNGYNSEITTFPYKPNIFYVLQDTSYKWEESERHIPEIMSRAIQQFVSWFDRVRDRTTDHQLLWGDEVRYKLNRNSIQLSITKMF